MRLLLCFAITMHLIGIACSLWAFSRAASEPYLAIHIVCLPLNLAFIALEAFALYDMRWTR